MSTTRTSVIMALVAVVGLVVSAIALWPRPGPADSSFGAPVPRPPHTSSPAVHSPGERVLTRPAVGRAQPRPPRPTAIRVDAIDLMARVRPVGVTSEGLMSLPEQPWVLGWYEFGGVPGVSAGSSVLAGHLDSRRYGVGPLVGLRDLRPGDRIEITLANGRRSTYSVLNLRRYEQGALPEELFARTGPPVLRIITCGGGYDADAGGYQQNLVVSAVPA